MNKGVKMKRVYLVIFSVLFSLSIFSIASASTIELVEWAFNIDGVVSEDYFGDLKPVDGVLVNGSGSYTWSTNVVGEHYLYSFFDFQIDANVNSFTNENGSVSGTPANGQSWEVDDPFGDSYGHAISESSLNNTNNVQSGEHDVAFAMGWNFSLTPGQIATITLIFSENAPDGAFYLEQRDPHTNQSLYFSSALHIVPVPSTILLLASGLFGLAGIPRKKNQMK